MTPRPHVPIPCPTPGCPELQPCPAHGRTHGWGTSRRKDHRAGTGWDEAASAKRIIRHYGGICHVCHQPGADQVDHVIPLAEGGTDTETNKRPIHKEPCHRIKTEAEKQAGRARSRREP
jgi:5-methylcytosine-specific restriction protein A